MDTTDMSAGDGPGNPTITDPTLSCDAIDAIALEVSHARSLLSMASAKMSELITCEPAIDRIWLYVEMAMERHLNAINLALEVGDQAD